MSFRRRNVAVQPLGAPGAPRAVPPAPGTQPQSPSPSQPQPHPAQPAKPLLPPGLRPSPVDGRPTMSTGTPTLDGLMAGHAGLALGSSVLVEESSTTDFAGALLRYYAAEGVVQEHRVHVVGVGPAWGRLLPEVVEGGQEGEGRKRSSGEKERMKIAWRYERLGEFGGSTQRAPPIRLGGEKEGPGKSVFCHTFDLTKRLTHHALPSINYISLGDSPNASPFTNVIQNLSRSISTSSPTTVHRIVIPSLLSPALYPAHASRPEHLLQFLHALRALLSRYSTRVTAMLTFPLSLYPRSSGLVRWAELLCDGVFELVPFPHLVDASPVTRSGAATAQEEPPQGMLYIHRLPVLYEREGVDAVLGEDWAFTLSRKRFAIKPFNLPPIEGDTEAQQHGQASGPNEVELEF